jgi:1,4-alpha-glucan branching enzyme
MKKSDLRGKKKVKFSFKAEPGKDVCVAGTFNDWQPGKTKLKGNGSGSYAVTLQLPAGRYEYKFIVDSEWCTDPRNPEAIPNDCGSMNNVIIVE